MGVIARTWIGYGGAPERRLSVTDNAAVAARWAANGFQVDGPYVLEAEQPQGAVDQRDRLLVWLHTADHYDGSVPFEGCPLCDEVRRQLDITGGQ